MSTAETFERYPKQPSSGTLDYEQSYARHEALLGKKFTRDDLRHQFTAKWQYYLDRARFTADNQAQSYRDFHVGAALVAVDEKYSRLGVFYGGNFKQDEVGDKACAEQIAYEKLTRRGFNYIIGLVVTGPPQPDKHTGIVTPTLPPCGDCRRILDVSPFTDAETLVITADTEAEIVETTSLEQLITKFGTA